MLKLGIITVDGLAKPFTWLGKERHASLLLLQELARGGHEESRPYDRLVRRMLMPNGTCRHTVAGRLREVDKLVLKILKRTHQRGSSITVTDLGVSSGVTSVEFYEMLSKWFSVRFIASDLYRDVFAVRSRRWKWAVIVDQSGIELQHIIGRFVLPGQISESLFYPVNRLLKVFSKRFLAPRARDLFERSGCREQPYFVARRVGTYDVCRMPFFSSRCLRLMEETPDFRFEVLDITRGIPHKSTVVRAMNLISRQNFSDDQLRAAIRHCVDAVQPGGLLVMGRCSRAGAKDVRATIYHLDHSIMTPLARLKQGCELEPLVQQVASEQEARRSSINCQGSNHPHGMVSRASGSARD